MEEEVMEFSSFQTIQSLNQMPLMNKLEDRFQFQIEENLPSNHKNSSYEMILNNQLLCCNQNDENEHLTQSSLYDTQGILNLQSRADSDIWNPPSANLQKQGGGINYFQKLQEIMQIQMDDKSQQQVSSQITYQRSDFQENNLPKVDSQQSQQQQIINAQEKNFKGIINSDSSNNTAHSIQIEEDNNRYNIQIQGCDNLLQNYIKQSVCPIAQNSKNETEQQQQQQSNEFGSLSFEEFKFSEKGYEIDEIKEQKNQMCIKYILPQTIYQSEVFLLNGEIIVSLDMFDATTNHKHRKEHDKVSLWSMFRPIHSITMKQNTIEVTMHNSQHTLSEFNPLIEKLMSLNDKQAYASAQMLQKYHVSLQKEQLIKQQVFDQYGKNINQLQWQLEENFLKSKLQADEILKQLPSESFYLYSIRRTDPSTFDNVFCALGYSKALIRLMAGSESNYSQFCFRSGLVEFFDKRSLMEILLMNLLVCNKAKLNITTLDDYTMPIELRVYYYKLAQTEILPGIFKEDYMKVYQILVDEQYLNQIHLLRGFSHTEGAINNTQAARIVPPELNYQLSAHNFIERYYSDSLKDKHKKQNGQSINDPHNFTADFQRLFGNQNEGSNYLHNVFNTTFKSNNDHLQHLNHLDSLQCQSPKQNEINSPKQMYRFSDNSNSNSNYSNKCSQKSSQYSPQQKPVQKRSSTSTSHSSFSQNQNLNSS